MKNSVSIDLSYRQLTPISQSDNEEACKACNGGGLLVVCDNCDNAYHFLCADPPLEESSQRLDKPWYCNPCASRDENPRRYERTIFQPLLQAADNTCPQLFELPRWLENHFEGVRRGPGGDYDDSVPAEKM
ncbi:hypothetical protein P152DRAFT_404180 [Eremomyces bilateralis CBS 781.70]|uniref:PHD-type domain-containing protein n=1 Tax=Eremomyces bilateralis CBS 781.70 TaxID=1392243 RepID=A0A6G1FTF4_9PEZI|nr:uncharacterized protein P152DRAFT_404180 [Eremomyces bilateralis CBS 781.70]KAF1809016.1 hypothetical protein P152DRAFT_404180 [Eremomyces bilateralis CBS 781.70]